MQMRSDHGPHPQISGTKRALPLLDITYFVIRAQGSNSVVIPDERIMAGAFDAFLLSKYL